MRHKDFKESNAALELVRALSGHNISVICESFPKPNVCKLQCGYDKRF